MATGNYVCQLWFILMIYTWLGLTMVASDKGDHYKVQFCMCNLDPYLRDVRTKLENEEIPPSTPNPYGLTTILTTIAEVTTTTTVVTTTAEVNETTEESVNETTTESPTTAEPTNVRKKRSVALAKSTGEFRVNTLGLMEPTGSRANFNGNVKISDDVGVFFDPQYSPGLCDCSQGSTVKLGICITNEPMTSNFSSSTSTHSKIVIGRILPWLDQLLMKALKIGNQYVRVLPGEIETVKDVIKPTFIVEFKTKFFLAEYEVKNAIEPQLKSVLGPKKFVGHYVTNRDVEGCVTTADLTQEDPREATAFDYLRFIFIPVSFAVLGLLVFCLCCGKSDKFYVRFW